MSATDQAQSPRGGQSTGARNLGLVLAVLAGAQFLVALDISIITVAVPSIEHQMAFSPAGLQWVVNAYALPFGGLLLLGGRLGDLFGRRRMFQIGTTVFVVCSLLGGLAQSPAWLIASRAGQGIGAALLSPNAFALVATTFTDGPSRNKAFGIFSATAGAASAAGVILGGVLTKLLTWRSVFFVNVPLGVLVFIGAAIVIAEPALAKGRKLDIVGGVTVTIGAVALVNGAVTASSSGWTAVSTIASFVVAVVFLVAFVIIQAKREQPLISLRLFHDRNRSGAFVVQFLNNSVNIGFYYFLSKFLQEVLHYNSLTTGVALLPAPIVVVAAAQVAGRLLAKIGPRPLLLVGGILLSGGLPYASFLSPDTSYATRVVPALILVAAGYGGMVVPVTVTAISRVSPRDTGMATGVLNTCQQVGGAFGLAAMVSVAVGITGAATAKPAAAVVSHAYGSALLLAAVIAFAGLIVAMLTIRPQARAAAH
jgi:EmrB/QacA subfamily drug resistance transporter